MAGIWAGVQTLIFISLWAVAKATKPCRGIGLLQVTYLLSALGLGLGAAAAAYWSAPTAASEAQRWFAEQTELAVGLAQSQVQGPQATAADFLLDAAMEFTATDQAFAVSTAWVMASVLTKLWQYYVVLQNRSNEYYFPSRRANAVRRVRAVPVTRWDHSWSTKSSQRVGFALLALILSYQGTHGSIEPDPPVRDGSIPALEPIDMGDQNCLWMLAVILLMCA